MLVEPGAPFGSYFNTSAKECMWRKYQINEKGLRSEFLHMEQIKLTHAVVMRTLDV